MGKRREVLVQTQLGHMPLCSSIHPRAMFGKPVYFYIKRYHFENKVTHLKSQFQRNKVSFICLDLKKKRKELIVV